MSVTSIININRIDKSMEYSATHVD